MSFHFFSLSHTHTHLPISSISTDLLHLSWLQKPHDLQVGGTATASHTPPPPHLPRPHPHPLVRTSHDLRPPPSGRDAATLPGLGQPDRLPGRSIRAGAVPHEEITTARQRESRLAHIAIVATNCSGLCVCLPIGLHCKYFHVSSSSSALNLEVGTDFLFPSPSVHRLVLESSQYVAFHFSHHSLPMCMFVHVSTASCYKCEYVSFHNHTCTTMLAST